MPNCTLCDKEIHYLNELPKNLDSAGYAFLDNRGYLKLTGDYGSMTLDMSQAIINDYEIYKKLMDTVVANSKTNTLTPVCDGCISRLQEEKKITILDFEYSDIPIQELDSMKKPFGKLISGLDIQESDIFLPYPRVVIALYFNKDKERIVNLINSHIYARLNFRAEISSIGTITILKKFEDGTEEYFSEVREGDVFLLYSTGTELEILSEERFKRNYQNI